MTKENLEDKVRFIRAKQKYERGEDGWAYHPTWKGDKKYFEFEEIDFNSDNFIDDNNPAWTHIVLLPKIEEHLSEYSDYFTDNPYVIIDEKKTTMEKVKYENIYSKLNEYGKLYCNSEYNQNVVIGLIIDRNRIKYDFKNKSILSKNYER